MYVKDFQERRQRLLRKIDGGLGVVFAARETIRNHDVHHPFHQDSNFKYLTGLNEPNAILVLATRTPEGEQKNRSILFVRPKNPRQEMWTGKRPGPLGAQRLTGVDESYSLEDFHKVFSGIVGGHRCLYLDFYNQDQRDCLFKYTAPNPGERKSKIGKPQKMEHIIPLLGNLRLCKGPEEIEQMKKAVQISSKAHRAAMAVAAPNISEKQVQALMEYIMLKDGAETWAYPGIVASGENALVLHYIENKAPLKKGELILIDVGAQYNNYAADITRTFPVDGLYSEPQREMYQAVLQGQKEGIEKARPGNTLGDIHRAALLPIVEWMIKKQILSGDAQKLIEQGPQKGGYGAYYVHSTGHWLGLDVHDNCPYQDEENRDISLAPGMVTTIEPGLYFSPDDKRVPQAFRGLGIRIEDDILITEYGPENLSSDIPKEVEEIEEACRQNYKDFI